MEEFNSRVADPECLRRILELFAAESLWKLAAEGKRGYVGSVEYPTKSSNPGEEGTIGWREVHLFIGTDASGAPVANLLGRNITAESGQEAIEKVTSGDGGYDVVMMDIRMPGLSGLEAAKAIRAWEGRSNNLESDNRKIPHVPIIAWSANAFAEDREAALAAGMDDHIAKGVQPAVLQECIARHLKN